MNLYESIKGNQRPAPKKKSLKESKVGPTIKLSDTYREIKVPKGSISATPSIAREINGKKPIKKIAKGLPGKAISINETAEEVDAFWAKVDNGEIKVGDKLPTSVGQMEILDLDKGADYILIKQDGKDYYVAAWAPGMSDDKLVWGQGHYFMDKGDEAKNFFEKKKLGESCKGKKGKKKLKEAIDVERLRAARGRDVQQQNNKNNSVREQIDKNAKEAVKKLNAYGYDNLIDTGNYLNDEGLLDKGLDLRDKDTLISDGWSHKLGFLRKGKQPISWFAIKGGGACGDAGIIFTKDGYTLTDDNCDGELYASVNDIPERELRYFADLADWANNSNLGGVDRFTSTLEKTVNAYMDKYPELQESCKGKKKGKASKKKLNESLYELGSEYGGRKSYYGKAQVEVSPDGKILYSYGTPIMKIVDGKPEMLCGEWALTNTTIRHIREFMQQEGLSPIPKAKLVKLIDEKGLNESCGKKKRKPIKEANGTGEPEFWSHRRSGELEELWGYLKGSDNLDYIKEQLDKIYAIAKEEIVG